tara:strand:+ start:461 stop:796 length:336 start_codon:yes stop_codon:yes gene_type:complete
MWFNVLKQYGAISAFGETFRPNKHTDSKLPVRVRIEDETQNKKLVYQENFNTVPEAFNRIKELANKVHFKVEGGNVNGFLVSNKNPNNRLKYWIDEGGSFLNRPSDRGETI